MASDAQDSALMGEQAQPIFRPEDWISKAEAARIRGVTRQAIEKLVSKRKLPILRIGGRILLLRQAVESYRPAPAGRPAKGKKIRKN